MSALRFLFLLLIVLNLLALATIRGWLGTPERAHGEPERLSNQLHPELIRLHPATATAAAPSTAAAAKAAPPPTVPTPATPAEAPAAAPAAQARGCFALSGLTAGQADEIAGASSLPEVSVAHSTTKTPTAWWVRIPPAPSREAAERKMNELRAQGVTDLFIVQDSGPNHYAISLGLFKGENAARQQLAELRAKGVRGAEIATRNGTIHRLEIRGPEETLASLASELATRYPAAERGECRP